MDKVKVSQEEAKAFETLKQVIAKRKGSDEASQLVLGFAELTAGYDVELSPEEMVRQMFFKYLQLREENYQDMVLYHKYDGVLDGMKHVLLLYDIKIEGVNY
ncbi:hypothetical protein MTP04_02370 [Lysinibacillus sp. PLM2]|nr:hypothetical protein MTP04_02370 [Lysinibacillus sp. PLM2]